MNSRIVNLKERIRGVTGIYFGMYDTYFTEAFNTPQEAYSAGVAIATLCNSSSS